MRPRTSSVVISEHVGEIKKPGAEEMPPPQLLAERLSQFQQLLAERLRSAQGMGGLMEQPLHDDEPQAGDEASSVAALEMQKHIAKHGKELGRRLSGALSFLSQAATADGHASTSGKRKAKSKAKPAPRAIKMARPSPSTVSKPWAPKPKDPEVVGAGSPFAGVGLSDDRVCDMPFGDLVAAMEKAGFSKERTSEGKAYRKRLKNRRHVMQYSNRKKAGSTTLSSQNDGLKATIISLKKRNDSLVGVHGRLSEELRLATAVRHEAVTGMEDLQAQMAALQSAVAALTVGGV
jgi:hypothetical protein